jgi:hypothetical protein
MHPRKNPAPLGLPLLSACGLWAVLLSTPGCKKDSVRDSTPPPPPALSSAGVLDAGGTGTDAGTSLTGILLSPTIPPDVTATSSTLEGLQSDFDVYSWNTFIAVNWPAGADGKADPSQRPGQNGDNATVWENWMPATSIFLAGGQEPTWGGNPIPSICQQQLEPGMRLLTQVGKTPGLLSESVQPFDSGPLIDQAGNYARFEVLVNRPMFDYIVRNKLYSKSGQKAFNAPANFPCGDNSKSAEGAIMVKAAWKLLEDPADAARFHTVKALVYTPASKDPAIQESCQEQLVGLVGLHIAHKTTSAGQWIWSTFEHVDNVPDKAEVDSGKLQASYNFYNPACKACTPNQTPPRPWDPNKKIVVGGKVFASQIVRIGVLPPAMRASAERHNAQGQTLLAGVNPASVWTRYELISTQWPTQPADCSNPIMTDGKPAPQFLANATLETYIQGNVPNVSSSCIRCHGNATMTNAQVSDFTFLLQQAR